mmetsp:Transcript_12171/g.11811  ORF Transcript_12171/g.11811 Transcript_12171/m.11811 type:complete len:255 (-) Transcript_12171:732-1496(-)|eukprot:CAMPEP_0119037938 /NCGR_PEP_ID=MMETSP1177-20130426/6504_1 /TAXON_ID=2985 /ORGANISM="Ochromonas sp, Strain CCMP1899" /LENGTH=254 /DNA_ID=CAMNT_0006999781 /DNA_START=111 /DNA_END=875 /DNA_ORIENTATION=-
MPRKNSGTNSRSIHTANNFSKHSSPFDENNRISRCDGDKHILSTRHTAERDTQPRPVKDKLRKALVMKDLRQTDEGMTLAVVHMVHIYVRLMEQLVLLCWRIAITLTVPSVHALEMNTILNHLLARHEMAKHETAGHDMAKHETAAAYEAKKQKDADDFIKIFSYETAKHETAEYETVKRETAKHEIVGHGTAAEAKKRKDSDDFIKIFSYETAGHETAKHETAGHDMAKYETAAADEVEKMLRDAEDFIKIFS